MGLFGDIKSRVVLEYKAEVEDAKRALRDLTGEQKKQAQAAVTGVEDQIKAHERLASKITLGMGIAAGAIALGVDSFNHYAETVRLRSATVGVDMGRLRDASHGLLTDMELMQVAAQGLNGRFKLTSDELEVVLGASVQLQRMGLAPLSEATQKLGEAVKKGEVEPLKELGIAYDENLAKTDKRAAALKALGELSTEAAKTTNTETEAVIRHGQEFKNAMNSVRDSLGEVVVAMAPLIAGVAKLATLAANIVGSVASILGGGGGPGVGLDKASWMPGAVKTSDRLGGTYIETLGTLWDLNRSAMDRDAYDMRRDFDASKRIDLAMSGLRSLVGGVGGAATGVGSFTGQRKRSGGGGGFDLRAATGSGMANFILGDGEAVDRAIEQWVSERLTFTAEAVGGDSDELRALLGMPDAEGKRTMFRGAGPGFAAKAMKAQGDRKVTDIMERLFGSKEQFDVYATGWGMVKDAALSAYDAMVTGSESAGAAIKKALAGSIHGVGQKMFVRGLEETAEGVASLLFNPAAAGQHFAAAGLFFAGSATAGAVASALGGGGGSAAGRGSGASASGVGLGSRSAPNTPINRTYVIGDSFWYSSPRQQAAMFSSMDRRAQSFEPPPTGVAYS